MKAGKILWPVLAALALALVWAMGGSVGGNPAPLLSNATMVPVAGTRSDFAVFLGIENRGGPDRLTGASSAEAEEIVIAGAEAPGGPVIPGGATPSLSSDGAFLRLNGLTGPADDGRLVPLTLHFEQAGDITTRARLVRDSSALAAHAVPDFSPVYDVPTGETPPRLGLILTPENDSWTVTLELRDFTLSPDTVDMAHQPGQGHAHLYLDGLKLQRMYTNQARIGALPPGRHMVKVTLNTNDHRAFRVKGEPVSALALIDVR